MPETFTTYAELVEFIETQSAEIIQGPWTQELADAAKNLPTNGETADIISIVKEGATAGGGTATGAVALTGQSVASGGTGLYSAVGAFTSVGLTVAIAAGATALGVSIGYVAGQKLYEANPQLWARLSDAVLPACLKFESGSEPSQPQVPMVIGADGKSYLPKSFMDLLKDALINEGMALIDTISPSASSTGNLTLNSLDNVNNNYSNLCNQLLSTASNGYRSEIIDKINTHITTLVNNCKSFIEANVSNYKIISAELYCNYEYDSYSPEYIGTYNVQVAFNFIESSDYSKVINIPFNIISKAPGAATITNSGDYLVSSNYIDNCSYTSVYSDITLNEYGEFITETGWGQGGIFGGDVFSEFWNNVLMVTAYHSIASFSSFLTNLGNWINNRPDGVTISEGAILPDLNTPIDGTYPNWATEWITITKPPTLPDVEPDEQEYYIPVEIPTIDPEVGDGTQDDGQGGEISTIPQEIPIITGLPEIIRVIDPTPEPPTPPQPNPNPDPIPNPSPTPSPEPAPTPSPTPSPQPIPEPGPIPSPQPQPEPEPEPDPQPQPQPQPEPVPPTPPTPPTDLGTDPPIVLPPIDPDNGIGAVYKPSRSELRSLSAFLWSTSFIDQIKKLFQSPAEAIISLHQLYVTPSTGGSDNIYLGYLDSEVTAPVVTNQFVTLDCGTVSVPSKYYNATDYSPYTSVSIYLPFVGIRELNADDVIGGTVNVTYRVDVLSGACLASVKCVRGSLSAVLYCFEGNCAVQLPVSGSTFGGPMAGMMVAGAVALGTALTAGAGASAATIATKAGVGAAGGMIAGSKTSIQKSGNFAGNAGALGSKKPYIIITRPIPCDASLYNHFYGFPANVTVQLNTLTGFTRVSSVHVQDISSATDEEKRMIEEILKSGFIV